MNLLLSEPGKYQVQLNPEKYLFECWGAQGGFVDYEDGGRGAYVSGTLYLNEVKTFFLYVGEAGKPKSTTVTFNGGGAAYQSVDIKGTSSYSCSGGGASDVRLSDGTWNNMTSLLSRIMIAAGGGGEVRFDEGSKKGKAARGGFGGVYRGSDGDHSNSPVGDINNHVDSTGGTQKSGGNGGGDAEYGVGNKGSFGKGASANPIKNEWPCSGGGSGYFGGGSGGVSASNLGSGAGGSSFVSGKEGCEAIKSGTNENSFEFSGSIHMSGLRFTNIIMKAGNETFLSPFGYEEIGHKGNGAIRIRLIITFSCATKKINISFVSLLIIIFK